MSPYLGFGSLEPALDLAQRNGRGVFVLAATSNPEGAQVQRAVVADGRTVAQVMVDEAAARNRDGSGSVGVVLGATVEHPPDLGALNGPVLVPGVGAQGGGAADVRRFTGTLLPSTSREVLRAGPSVSKLRAAVEAANEAFAFLRD